MRRTPVIAILFLVFFTYSVLATNTNLNTLIMPAAKLAVVKAALPQVANSNLSLILNDPGTLWYDSTVMSPSYQDSVGVAAIANWPKLVAASQDVIDGIFDQSKTRFQFPFGATAGTDDCTNIQIENFVYLPQTNGQVQTINITEVPRNYNREEWTWTYPTGTVFGEILFITDGSNILPAEIRTRTRYATGWSMNAYRPFPQATDLVAAIEKLRPNWNSVPALTSMIQFLGDNTTLQPFTLAAQGGLASTFSQDGYLDTLPDFGDDDLVRSLLTTTPFIAAYDTAWKTNGTQVSYAPTTTSALSIVPNNYKGGMIQVTDDSCMRCHQSGGTLMSDYYEDLYLYGEMWGKDAIFTFHPYDESQYQYLREEGVDNRAVNPVLKQAQIFATTFGAK
jgi:hypothetical protein